MTKRRVYIVSDHSISRLETKVLTRLFPRVSYENDTPDEKMHVECIQGAKGTNTTRERGIGAKKIRFYRRLARLTSEKMMRARFRNVNEAIFRALALNY